MQSNNKELNTKELLTQIKELESEIKKLKSRKKFGLVWEEKTEDVVLACETNVPIIKEVKSRKLVSDNSQPTNILIEGDNYHSLSVLNYTHKGKVDVIYIDPPYNTGNKDFVYNDEFIDRENAFRHSSWLSFIEKRLYLAKELLSDNGVIFISIDDNEQAYLKVLCDHIFGENNFLSQIIIKSNPGGRDYGGIALTHEYLLCYGKRETELRLISDEGKEFTYRDSISEFDVRELRNRNVKFNDKNRPNLCYPFYVNPLRKDENDLYEISLSFADGYVEVMPLMSQGVQTVWRWGKDKSKENLNINVRGKMKQDGTYMIVEKYRSNKKRERSIWDESSVRNESGSLVLKEIFNNKPFDYPKSLDLIVRVLNLGSFKSETVILDFFAGSGTTGHAVLELNKQDGGNRKFILCTNNENRIAEEVTYERLKRVIKGYKNKKGEKIDGLGGNLSYYKTGLVDVEKLQKVSDESKIKITYQAGEMIAIRENTLNESDKNDWWQIFENDEKKTVIYFKEDKSKLSELVELLEYENKPVVLYIFGWGKNEYKNEYSTTNIRIEDIPEPIIEVYKEINRI